MHQLRLIWRRWTARRYTRLLEAEVTRLRAENRALLNSILGIAGVPPILVETTEGTSFDVGSREEPAASGSGLDSQTVAPLQGTARVNGRQGLSAPVRVQSRRRSWYQINRALEIDAARKKVAEAEAGSKLGTLVKNR